MTPHHRHIEVGEEEQAVTAAAAKSEAPPWELVAAGRYRPRRIRGSFPGRELG